MLINVYESSQGVINYYKNNTMYPHNLHLKNFNVSSFFHWYTKE